MLLTLEALTASGVMGPYVNEWRRRDPDDQTWPNFVAHFTRANKVRIDELTTITAGFHSANLLGVPPPGPPQPPPTGPPAGTIPATTAVAESITLHYCWSHGLSRNAQHTSATCATPKPGHQNTATLLNPMNGSNIFRVGAAPRSGKGGPRRGNQN